MEAEAKAGRGRGLENVLAWCGDNLHLCWAYVALAMFILAALSVPFGISSVAFDGRLTGVGEVALDPGVTKEVGYLFALNWSLYSIVILPLMAIFAIRVWTAMPETINALTEAGMIRDGDFKRVEAEVVLAKWRQVHRGCGFLFGAVFVCIFIFVMADWWTVVAQPILQPETLRGVTLDDPIREFDWSIACLYEGSRVGCGPLLVFGFAGYAAIAGLATALTFATCLSGLFFVAFMCGVTANRRRGWTLTAIPSAADDRGGFGLFSSFFTAFLCLSLCVAGGCLLMVIQNAYLRDPSSGDVMAFMFGDGRKMVDSVLSLPAGEIPGWLVAWLFEPAVKVYANPQTGVGILIYALTAVAAVGVSWGLLRSTARTARDGALANSAALAAELGVTNRVLRGRLKAMEFWPIGWLRLNQLVLLVVSLMLALASYRLLLVPVGLIALLGAGNLLKAFAARRAVR
jgi:hypothetical protein